MLFLSWVYRIRPEEYEVRTKSCHGCLRFNKTALKEKSGLFRLFNEKLNPVFDAFLERIITEEEMRQAKEYAQAATDGQVSPEQQREF